MKYIYFMLGLIFMGLGIVGVVLPVLPTTPFLLAALFFFSKSSKRAEAWFQGTKLYQNHIHDFVETRSMKKSTKIKLLAFASTMLIIAAILSNNLHVRILIAFLMVFKYYYFIFRIKTIPDEEESL